MRGNRGGRGVAGYFEKLWVKVGCRCCSITPVSIMKVMVVVPGQPNQGFNDVRGNGDFINGVAFFVLVLWNYHPLPKSAPWSEIPSLETRPPQVAS